MTLPVIYVYSRPGCHLCEQLIEQLLPVIRNRAHLEIRNIDTRAEWQQQFGTRIPVVEFEGAVIGEGHPDVDAIQRVLQRATGRRDRHYS